MAQHLREFFLRDAGESTDLMTAIYPTPIHVGTAFEYLRQNIRAPPIAGHRGSVWLGGYFEGKNETAHGWNPAEEVCHAILRDPAGAVVTGRYIRLGDLSSTGSVAGQNPESSTAVQFFDLSAVTRGTYKIDVTLKFAAVNLLFGYAVIACKLILKLDGANRLSIEGAPSKAEPAAVHSHSFDIQLT